MLSSASNSASCSYSSSALLPCTQLGSATCRTGFTSRLDQKLSLTALFSSVCHQTVTRLSPDGSTLAATVMRMQATGVDGLQWLGHVVDSLVYMFSPVLACFLLRILQVSSPIDQYLLS